MKRGAITGSVLALLAAATLGTGVARASVHARAGVHAPAKGKLARRLHTALRGEFAAARPVHLVRRLPHHAPARRRATTYSLDLSRVQNRVASRTNETGYTRVETVRDSVDVWTDRAGHVRHTVSTLGTSSETVPAPAPATCVDGCE
jgi:hypothetical protein